MSHRVVHLQPAAPPKPPPGAACNGCGVCCVAEPCPLGIALSRRRRGSCVALVWLDSPAGYRCGVLAEPARWLPLLPRRWATALAARWIGAGRGCDCDWEPAPARADRSA